MRHVMLTFVDPDDAAAYYRLSPEEQQADVERHIAWFRKHGERIVGGEELDEPARVKALRPGRQGEGVVVTDGPYVETKEILGGFVILETDTAEEARSPGSGRRSRASRRPPSTSSRCSCGNSGALAP